LKDNIKVSLIACLVFAIIFSTIYLITHQRHRSIHCPICQSSSRLKVVDYKGQPAFQCEKCRTVFMVYIINVTDWSQKDKDRLEKFARREY